MRTACRVYHLLLHLYPRQMQMAFGADMEKMFGDMMRAERAKGRWFLFVFVVRAWVELPSSAWASRRQWQTKQSRSATAAAVTDILADFRHAFRSLTRTPGFSITVVLTLALGIGATSSIFSVFNAVLLRPLPYPDPERLVFIWHRATNYEDAREPLAGDLRDLQALDHFESVAGAWALSTALSDGERPQQITLEWVTPGFSPVLGAMTHLGRWFRPSDVTHQELDLLADPESTPPLLPVVLSYGLHQERYGGDPDVLGSTLRINGQSMVVIGVAPRGFQLHVPTNAALPRSVDAWTLFPSDPTRSGRGRGTLTTVARLARGVPLKDAQATVDALATELRTQHAVHAQLGTQFDVVGMHGDIVGEIRSIIWILFGAVTFVLAIACANVATLFLVRSTTKTHELAIRTAVGGGRWRLLRLVLAENGLIIGAGAVGGLAVAHFSVDALLKLRPDVMPFAENISVDANVVLFAMATATVVALITGLFPAWRVSHTRPVAALGIRTGAGSVKHSRARAIMVTGQVALSVVLLMGAGLMMRTLVNLQRVELGFEPTNVTTARVSLPFFSYRDPDDRLQFYNRLVDNVRTETGIQRVGGISRAPLADSDTEDSFGAFSISSEDMEQWGTRRARYRVVIPGYLQAMQTRLLVGRTFERADNEPGAPLTVVVEEIFANRAWPDGSAIGKPVLIGTLNEGGTGSGEPRWADVVGIVHPIRQTQLDFDPRGTIYVPYTVNRWFELTLTVQSSLSSADVAGVIRTNVTMLDRNLPVATMRSMDDFVRQASAPTRFTMTILGAFALIALTLAAVGIYGVVAYVTGLRQSELGIRLAFGATHRWVLRSVLAHGLWPAIAGLSIGIPIALGVSQSLERVLYGVTPTDVTTIAVIAALTIFVTGAASIGPAWKAIHIDPVTTLRNE